MIWSIANVVWRRLILLALVGGVEYVAAVHPLDEVYFSKEDWPYYALGIEILKARQYAYFMNNEELQGSPKGRT